MIELGARPGARPKTNYGLPHQQLDQNPSTEIYRLLKASAYDFPLVERRPSAISVPGAEALWLTERPAHSCVDAFMIGNEFAHVHPPYDGSMHMMLPAGQVDDLLAKGWGEHHPLVASGKIPPTAVMVFAPRDAGEVDILVALTGLSYRFAKGEIGVVST